MSRSKEEEDPFELIEKGNAMEESSNWWSAADFYGRATLTLRNLAKSTLSQSKTLLQSTQVGPSKIETRKQIKEARMIARLYAEQSQEYLFKSRKCLLRALEFERMDDRRRMEQVLGDVKNRDGGLVGNNQQRENVVDKLIGGDYGPLLNMISEEEGCRRVKIFQRIFAFAIERDVAVKREEEEENQKEGREKKVETKKEVIEKKEEEKGTQQEESALDDLPKVTNDKPDETKGESQETQSSESKNESENEATPSKEEEKDLPPPDNPSGKNQDNDTTISTLESRLASLDTPLLPPTSSIQNKHFPDKDEENKPESERVSDIHKGLRRLGVSGWKESEKPGSLFRQELEQGSKSTEEQVQDIINQAKDEVRLEGGGENGDLIDVSASGGGGGGDALSEDDDLATMFAKVGLNDEDLSDMNAFLDGSAAVPSVSNKVASDQKKSGEDLKQLSKMLGFVSAAQSLLVDASSYLEEHVLDEEESEEDDDDDKDKVTTKKRDNMAEGKKRVLGAKKCLDRVLASMP